MTPDHSSEDEIASAAWADELAILEAEAEVYGEVIWDEFLVEDSSSIVHDPHEHLQFSDQVESFWASNLSNTVDAFVQVLTSQQLVSVGDSVSTSQGVERYSASDRVHDITERLMVIARAKRALEAVETRLLAEVPQSFADDATDSHTQGLGVLSAANQIAVKTHTSDTTISTNIGYAYQITQELPQVLDKMTDGKITFAHAREIARAGLGLTSSQKPHYCTAAIEIADNCTAGRLKRRLPKLVAQLAPECAQEFTKRAYEERRVWATDTEDGMAILSAILPAPLAYAALDRLTRIAKQTLQPLPNCSPEAPENLHEAPPLVTDSRTLGQARADVFAEFLLASASQRTNDRTGDPFGYGIAGKIHMTVPVTAVTHTGRNFNEGANAPHAEAEMLAELEGYGHIDPEITRFFAADARSWNRIFVDRKGQVVTTDNYEPTAAIRRHIIARDRHCRFPGCLAPPTQCEIDHTHDWAKGGKTATSNLALLCKRHHTLKHPSLHDTMRWTVQQSPGGKLTWTTPSGDAFTDMPESIIHAKTTARLRAQQKSRVSFKPSDPPPRQGHHD